MSGLATRWSFAGWSAEWSLEHCYIGVRNWGKWWTVFDEERRAEKNVYLKIFDICLVPCAPIRIAFEREVPHPPGPRCCPHEAST